MKKLSALLLAGVVLVSAAACGSDQSEAPADTQKQSHTVTKESQKEEKKEIAFEKIAVVDNEECSITLTELDPDNLWGYTIKTLLENKSEDKNYWFTLESASVNGVLCSDMFSAEVAPGKKANEELNLLDSDLKENGITEYTDIELTFRVYDSDDWSADDAAYETVHVYPYGEENAAVFEREPQPEDVVLIDTGEVTMILTGYTEDPIWGYTANLFLVNKTDKDLMFREDDTSINGYMVSDFFASTVPAGKCEFTSISWSDSELEKNGITQIEEIEMTIRVYDADHWTEEDLINETITLNP